MADRFLEIYSKIRTAHRKNPDGIPEDLRKEIDTEIRQVRAEGKIRPIESQNLWGYLKDKNYSGGQHAQKSF